MKSSEREKRNACESLEIISSEKVKKKKKKRKENRYTVLERDVVIKMIAFISPSL